MDFPWCFQRMSIMVLHLWWFVNFQHKSANGPSGLKFGPDFCDDPQQLSWIENKKIITDSIPCSTIILIKQIRHLLSTYFFFKNPRCTAREEKSMAPFAKKSKEKKYKREGMNLGLSIFKCHSNLRHVEYFAYLHHDLPLSYYFICD